MRFDRPLAFLDFETTGVKVKEDKILEVGIHLIFPVYDGAGKWVSILRESKGFRVNPGIPIPEGATAVHGISDDDVKDCPKFNEPLQANHKDTIAQAIYKMICFDREGNFEPKDLVGFNSNRFDFPLLLNEFWRAGIDWDYTLHRFIDVGNIFKIMFPRTLSEAVKIYLGTDHTDAHSAEADIKATADVFLQMIKRHGREEDNALWTPKTMQEMALFSNYGERMADLSGNLKWSADGTDLLFNIGEKTKGTPVRNDPGFVQWMRSKNFPRDTMRILDDFLAGG